MAKLKLTYDTKEEIPAGFEELYTEKDGKWNLTGVEGLKTQADIDRQTTANRKERTEHAATKAKLKKVLEGLDIEADDDDALDAALGTLSDKLTRFTELEARGNQGEGKLKDEEREELIALRKEVGPLRAKLEKLEKRTIPALQTEVTTLKTERDGLSGTIRQGTIKDAVIEAATKAKADPDFYDLIVTLGERELEIDAESNIVQVKETGVSVADWVESLKEKRPKFWPQSVGGGALGGKGRDGLGGKANPWSAQGWNKTAQAAIVRDKGADYAKRMAEAVGSSVGALRAPQKAA